MSIMQKVRLTKEEMDDIARRIATLAKKDTDFPDANALEEEDLVAIVQNGINKKINLSDFANQLVNLSEETIQLLIDAAVKNVAFARSGSTAYWNAQIGDIPDEGEIIIYTDYQTIDEDNTVKYVPGIKIGSGNAYVQDLAFIDQKISDELAKHIANGEIHVTGAEKDFWNNKLNVTDSQEVVDEALIFNRN